MNWRLIAGLHKMSIDQMQCRKNNRRRLAPHVDGRPTPVTAFDRLLTAFWRLLEGFREMSQRRRFHTSFLPNRSIERSNPNFKFQLSRTGAERLGGGNGSAGPSPGQLKFQILKFEILIWSSENGRLTTVRRPFDVRLPDDCPTTVRRPPDDRLTTTRRKKKVRKTKGVSNDKIYKTPSQIYENL